MKPRGSLARYRKAASEHLAWCDAVEIPVVGGRWDLEDPLSGLLLSSVVDPGSASFVLNALTGSSWSDVVVSDVWWPNHYVDMIVNFQVAGDPHMLMLEHKHLDSPSNQPGWRKKEENGEPIYWQTEAALLEIDRARSSGESVLLGGPFDPDAHLHAVLLDARGRTMGEAFEENEWMPKHRHDAWAPVSYEKFAARLRKAYEQTESQSLVPVLGQLFASERQ